MNRFQKQLNKEVKRLIQDKMNANKPHASFRATRHFNKIFMKYQWFTPCEDCDNPQCKLPKNKMFYCVDRR